MLRDSFQGFSTNRQQSVDTWQLETTRHLNIEKKRKEKKNGNSLELQKNKNNQYSYVTTSFICTQAKEPLEEEKNLYTKLSLLTLEALPAILHKQKTNDELREARESKETETDDDNKPVNLTSILV